MKNTKLRIVYTMVDHPYLDDNGYQEALWGKYNVKDGHDVTIITTNRVILKMGGCGWTHPQTYFDKNGVRIIRIPFQDKHAFYKNLVEIQPDFIFIAGFFSDLIGQIPKYIRHVNNQCVVVGSNHATIDNYPFTNPSNCKEFYDTIERKIVHRYLSKYLRKIYGILPNCLEINVNYFGFPRAKQELLPLGCDDDLLDFNNRNFYRKSLCEKYGISEDAILFVHGGKLDYKKNTLNLVKAFSRFDEHKQLLIFGNFPEQNYGQRMKEEIERVDNVQYIGYLGQQEMNELFLATDIGIFPGSASCIRQQALAAGLALVYKKNKADADILDIEGCYKHIGEDAEKDILEAMEAVVMNDKYIEMKKCAREKGVKTYAYSSMARKILEENINGFKEV